MPPSFIRTAFPLAAPRPTLDALKDTPTPSPRLQHSPSTISSNSQSSISISIRRRVSTIVSKFHLRTTGGGSLNLRGRPRMRTTSTSTSTSISATTTSATHNSMGRRKNRYAAVENISTIPWPRSPSRSPSPPSPDIRPPSGLGRRASSISDLEIAALERDYPLPLTPPATAPLLASPRSPVFPRSPTIAVHPESVLTSVPPSSFPQYPAARRTRTLSSPARLSYSETSPAPIQAPAADPDSDSEPPPPPPKDIFLLAPSLHTPSSVPHTPRTPRHARLQARQNPPIPLSLLFPYVPRADLPTLSLVSRRFRNAAQLALYRTLVLSSSDDDDTDACMARLAAAPHLAALVTTLIIPAYPPAHGASFQLALALALRSMRALRNLTLPAYDADILDAVTGASSSSSAGATRGLTHLTLLADTLPFSFFNEFLVSNPTIQHLSLPNFIGVPPGPGEVHPTAIPNLISLDASPGLAVSLAHGRLLTLRQVTLRVTSTLYDGLRPAAIFGALFGAGGGQVKVLSLVLAADVDRRTRGRLLSALAKIGEGLEVLELQLEGTSDEVRPLPL
ncbi:hypothetical protein F5888DRAFT_1745833 [Russula emetica]|nr:hypothetical protein F5888DRAFT_1745833 [Russula emetica]